MKKTLFIFITLLCLSCSQVQSESINWSLEDSKGESHDFPKQAIENKQVTVLFFWATWCPYCKQLMPHLQSTLYQYQDQLNLKIYAMNVKEDGEPESYLRSQGIQFNLFKEADEIAELYKLRFTPGVLIFDSKGKKVFDLRDVQSKHLVKKDASHGAKSIRLAPYWASEIRKALEKL